MKNTHLHLDMLPSDYLIWGLVLILLIFAVWGSRYPHWRRPWAQVMTSGAGAASSIILLFYTLIGLTDSIRFRSTPTQSNSGFFSLLDWLVQPLGQQTEVTYSAPFSNYLFIQSIVELPNGEKIRGFPPLAHVHGNLQDIIFRASLGTALGLIISLFLLTVFIFFYSHYKKQIWRISLNEILRGKTHTAWRAMWITSAFLWILVCAGVLLATHYHIFGTDKIGRDVFYQTIKSIRTGLIIGTITTLFALPFALLLGTFAGYFRGWIDDLIQYSYTTLSSIPGVLLIAASVLMLQVYMNNHAAQYPTLAQRADVRLLALCFILGITGWASLCRFLRGETLKLREMEFVQAAKALGVGDIRIILRHIIPNVFHIVIITLVLDFSVLVLAEAVLSYVGVGVDPTTMSWGNMINSSRLELAREPVVWWPLLAALISMFGLVIAANLFADAVRDAFDPYLRIAP
jgi:peptide/nickel transport system permease protein